VFSCGSGGGGGGVMATVGGGGGGSVRTVPPRGSGGGGGHTLNLMSGETRPASLASLHGARVLLGGPLGLIQIRAFCFYLSLGGDVSNGITSTGLSSSSSTVIASSSHPL
jgi:hypothetical protein